MATFTKRINEAGEIVGWQAKIRRKGEKPQSKTLPILADVKAWARDIENKMDRRIFVDRKKAETTTLKVALERYQVEKTVKKKGAAQEEYRIKALVASDLAPRFLASIRGEDVTAFRNSEEARGLAPSTVMKSLALLSHLFETARKEWDIEVDNPVRAIAKPKIDNARDRRLSPLEFEYLFDALDNPMQHVAVEGHEDRRNKWTAKIVRWAIETAMRQGEILALDWKHVDLVKRTAHLPDTKNGTSRTVPLSSVAAAMLKQPAGVAAIRRGKVFPTTALALKQSYSRAVDRGRQKYLNECKAASQEPIDNFLADFTFHDLRHEAISRLAEKLQLHELMRVTGHKDTRMLVRYYHPRAEDLAKKLG
jgi:integrase